MAYLKIKHRTNDGFAEGKYHDNDSIHDVINYITKPSKAISGYIGGIAVDPCNAANEMEALTRYYGQDHGIRLRHMIIAFSKDEFGRSPKYNAGLIYNLSYLIASYYGKEYQIIYAVHENTAKLHIHFVFNTTNYITGRKYEGDRKDLYDFIRHIETMLAIYDIKVLLVKDAEKDDVDSLGF